MSNEEQDHCAGAPTLIFSCSGAADVGGISDRAARQLTRDGTGKMFCLAGIGGRIAGILKTTEEAERILAIDGCSLNCVKSCLERADFSEFEHLQLGNVGLEKGKSEINEDNISRACLAAREMLG